MVTPRFAVVPVIDDVSGIVHLDWSIVDLVLVSNQC